MCTKEKKKEKGEPALLTHLLTCLSSAKDKVILESAYNANPKPDKAARLDIVKRVSLNEKEVQVRAPVSNTRRVASLDAPKTPTYICTHIMYIMYTCRAHIKSNKLSVADLVQPCARADLVPKPPPE